MIESIFIEKENESEFSGINFTAGCSLEWKSEFYVKMASGEGEKYVDEFMVKDISKFVVNNKFIDFINALRLKQYELDDIFEDNSKKDERVKAVSITLNFAVNMN